MATTIRNGAFELLPDGDDQHFRGRLLPFQEGHVQVQVFVVDGLLDPFLDDVLELLQIHAVARVFGGLALDGHVQLVVVAVPVGVGAFAKDLHVFGLVPILVPQFVGGIEMSAAGDVNVLHGLDNRAKVADVPMEYLRVMIVVTGAAGFIGSVLAVRLLEADYRQLVLVDDFSVEAKRANHHHLPVTRVDRSAFPEWLRANESQVQFIFHLGARTDTTEQDEQLLNALNLDYSKEIWNLCVEFGLPLVYASSAATYGDGSRGYVDSHDVVSDLQPLNPYGRSKNDFDVWALAQERKPYFWAGFKFFNVYGPNEFHKNRMASVVLHTFRQVQATGGMKLFRSHREDYQDGHQTRDFVHVEDVCSVLLHFMHHRVPVHSGLYNLGSGKGRTFLDLATATFHAMGQEPAISFIDTPEDIRDTYQYFTEADLTKLRANGYSAPFRSLEDGIADYVKNHLIPAAPRVPRATSGESA